jgi:hypothetical protein
MLHLLPIRLVLQAVAALAATAILAGTYAGWVGEGDTLRDAATVIRWSSSLAIAVIALLYAGWRWVPAVERFIFPYLGGRWSGVVKFQGGNGPDHRDVCLEVKHTLFGLKFLLDSNESTSHTLVVHAERNPDFERYRLYYVYLNERKEGVAGAGLHYRGIAVLRVECGSRLALHGDYFTDTHRSGTLHLTRDAANPWWNWWR